MSAMCWSPRARKTKSRTLAAHSREARRWVGTEWDLAMLATRRSMAARAVVAPQADHHRAAAASPVQPAVFRAQPVGQRAACRGQQGESACPAERCLPAWVAAGPGRVCPGRPAAAAVVLELADRWEPAVLPGLAARWELECRRE